MSKREVTVDEEALKGIMIGDLPVFGRRQVEQSQAPAKRMTASRAEDERLSAPPEATARSAVGQDKGVLPHANEYRSRYLVPMPSSLRSQTYISKDIYDRIKRFLPVIAPEVSISGYIGNILSDSKNRYSHDKRMVLFCGQGRLFRVFGMAPVERPVQSSSVRYLGVVVRKTATVEGYRFATFRASVRGIRTRSDKFRIFRRSCGGGHRPRAE